MVRLMTRVEDMALVAVYMQTAIITKESGKMINLVVLEVTTKEMIHRDLKPSNIGLHFDALTSSQAEETDFIKR